MELVIAVDKNWEDLRQILESKIEIIKYLLQFKCLLIFVKTYKSFPLGSSLILPLFNKYLLSIMAKALRTQLKPENQAP